MNPQIFWFYNFTFQIILPSLRNILYLLIALNFWNFSLQLSSNLSFRILHYKIYIIQMDPQIWFYNFTLLSLKNIL